MEPRENNSLPIVLGLALSVAAHLGMAAAYGPARRSEPVGTVFMAQKPDLTVTGLRVSSPRIADKPTMVTAMIGNLTSAAAGPFAVELRIDGVSAGRQVVTVGAAGSAQIEVALEHTVTQPGEHGLRIIADPDGRVAETDEANNDLEQRFVWQRAEEAKPKPTKPAGAAKPAAPAVSGFPDFAVTSVDVANPRIAGEPAKLTAKIANDGGSAASAFTVQVLLDDEPVGVIAIDGLAAGAVIEAQMDVVAKKEGPHTVRVVADSKQSVEESDKANNRMERRFEWRMPDEIPIGQKNGVPLSVNWIGYEDYKELLAKKGRFEQATYQRDVEPTPGANQTPLNPTDGARAEARKAAETEPQRGKPGEGSVAGLESGARSEPRAVNPGALVATKTASGPKPAPGPEQAPEPGRSKPREEPVATSGLKLPGEPREVALVAPVDTTDPRGVSLPTKAVRETDVPEGRPATTANVEPRSGKPAEVPVVGGSPPAVTSKPAPAKPVTTSLPQEVKPAPSPAASESAGQSRPTVAPRDQRDASPQSLRESLSVRPGRVTARHGLQINTVRPEFTAVALRSAIARNPDVVLTFDPAGKVVNVKITRGTGFENIDGPLLTSLYRWTATGEPLKKINGTLEVPFHIVLIDEDGQ